MGDGSWFASDMQILTCKSVVGLEVQHAVDAYQQHHDQEEGHPQSWEGGGCHVVEDLRGAVGCVGFLQSSGDQLGVHCHHHVILALFQDRFQLLNAGTDLADGRQFQEFVFKLEDFMGLGQERADSFFWDSGFPENILDLVEIVSAWLRKFDEASLGLLSDKVDEVLRVEEGEVAV